MQKGPWREVARGTKAEQKRYGEQTAERVNERQSEVEEDEGRKEAPQHFCLCQISVQYIHAT